MFYTLHLVHNAAVMFKDPYFPFAKAVENYAKSYAAMGINYAGATMNLDLLDRKNKYSNGFCHWPVPAWMKPDGTWVPSQTNFTSLADPTAVGSGLTALTTLMHEAGHAAHFANIKQPSPLFSQERAPTSVAYAENQSMYHLHVSCWCLVFTHSLINLLSSNHSPAHLNSNTGTFFLFLCLPRAYGE